LHKGYLLSLKDWDDLQMLDISNATTLTWAEKHHAFYIRAKDVIDISDLVKKDKEVICDEQRGIGNS